MTDSSTSPALAAISPFFIVRDVSESIAFYRDLLGFEVAFLTPEDAPFFAIVRRDRAQLMLKALGVRPLPNPKQHPLARWDAFILAPDPDAVAAEFGARGVTLRAPLDDTEDQLRGFELEDPDGYVLFFGRPV
jgi:catechol 2,3-dioxygenase-like lactoylglutathione lyase family enzyme